MSIFDIVLIAVAAFLNGWFINSLLRLETEGNRWPLVRRYLFTTVWVSLLLLTSSCSFDWPRVHLPHRHMFIISPCIASAYAAATVYQSEMRKRFHIPVRRKTRNLMA